MMQIRDDITWIRVEANGDSKRTLPRFADELEV